MHEILKGLGKDFAVFPVKVSKKQLKLAEKKAKKTDFSDNPHYPKKDGGAVPEKKKQQQGKAAENKGQENKTDPKADKEPAVKSSTDKKEEGKSQTKKQEAKGDTKSQAAVPQ